MALYLKYLSSEQDKAIRDAICPGCEFNLPDIRTSGGPHSNPTFYHALPRTQIRFDCMANAYREARFAEMNVITPSPVEPVVDVFSTKLTPFAVGGAPSEFSVSLDERHNAAAPDKGP